MRILLILLIGGLCLVTAKYIPHEGGDINTAHYRVKRSDSDSDSNTASVERDDNSSNNNDNEDNEDNDSAEKLIEKRNKLREKEEKRQLKLNEKIEKEKQQEIEHKRRLEEKLAKEQRKEQERKEKEERKIKEQIEKEKQKFEENKRKIELKLEKEERKRQEKIRKQLEKLQNEQKESAEDTYLETEEEDSVEMEDIWKAHVYDKYGINFTSTKLERQAALQRYLQEELGIDANSTKSERRQAILKLIQSKLQNDSVAVDSFRNLLLSHVNAAQLQKLRLKLENDLNELNTQSELLNNTSLPWASVAKQNVEEKRTFLQTISQFLTNIIPSWSTGTEPSTNSTQSNEKGVAPNKPPNFDASNINCSSGQPATSQSGGSNDNILLNNDIVGSENNLSVLPSNSTSGSSSNNPSQPKGPLVGDDLSNNGLVSKSDANVLSSSTGNSANSDTLNIVSTGSVISSSNPSKPDVPIDNGNVDGQSPVRDVILNPDLAVTADSKPASSVTSPVNGSESGTENSANSNSSNTVSTSSVISPTNPSEPDVPIHNANVDGQSPVPDNPLNPDLAVTADSQPALSVASSVNGLESSTGNSVNSNSLNTVSTSSVISSSNPSEPDVPIDNTNVYGQSPVSDITLNPDSAVTADSKPALSVASPVSDLESSTGNSTNSNSLNTVSTSSVISSSNPSEPDVPIDNANVDGQSPVPDIILNPNLAVTADSKPALSIASPDNGLESSTGNSGNSNSLNTVSTSSVISSGNPSEYDVPMNNANLADSTSTSSVTSLVNGLESSGSVNSSHINQNNVNDLPANKGDLANTVAPNTSISTSAGVPTANSLEPSVGNNFINNNISDSQVNIDSLPSNTDNLANVDSPNVGASTDSSSTTSNALGVNESLGASSINDNIPVEKNDLNGPSFNSDQSTNNNLSDTLIPADSSIPSELNRSLVSDSVNNDGSVSVDGSPFNTMNSNSSNSPQLNDSEAVLGNQLEPHGSMGTSSLNTNIPVSETNVNGLSSPNTDQSANTLSSNPLEWAESESTTSIVLEQNELVGSDNVNIIAPETSVSTNLGNISQKDNLSNSNSISNNSSLSQIEESIVHSGTDGYLNLPALSASELNPSNPLTANKSLNSNVGNTQSDGNELLSNGHNSVINSTFSDGESSSDVHLDNTSLPDFNLPVGSENVPGNPSLPMAPSLNVDVASGSQNRAPLEISNTKETGVLFSESNGNVPTESLISTNSVDPNSNPNGSDVASLSINGAVPNETYGSGDNSVTAATVVNDDALSSAVIINEPVALNVEVVTEVASTNTESLDQDPTANGNGVPVAVPEPGIILENHNAEIQINDSPTTSVAGINEIVTRDEIQTEQGIILEQELVNTPSDFITVSSVQSFPSPPPGVVVPIEEAASVVDIKLQ